MKRRTYKKGPSDEHARKMLVKEREREKNKVEIEKPLFRGFLAADGFITSKGSRGTKLDSMWSKHMIEAFPIDDDELLKIAMESCLFDIHAQVVGGEFGTPFSIGDYGFYAKNQFEAQRAVLDAVEREHCIGMFLSEGEWEKVNVKLYEIACFSYSKLDLAVRGDTILNIAIRDNAYKSAKILLDGGIDPLIENEEGSDLVHIIQQQYGAMSLRLSDLQAAKDRSKKKVLIPSEEKEIRDREKNTLDSLEHMVIFINALEDNLKARVKSIEDDKWTVKVATLRKQIDVSVFLCVGLGLTLWIELEINILLNLTLI